MDELAWRAGHKYVSLVVDHLRSRVVWVGEGKNEETLNGFFDELGEVREQAGSEEGKALEQSRWA